MRFRIARVDLSNKKWRDESIDDKTLRKYIGGRGLGVYLALKEIPKGIDAFDERNKIFILTGPLVGTGAFETGRYHVVGKSPQTGFLGDSNSGGTFGPWLRFAGFDGIIIEGKSEEPVWLSVVDGDVKFNDASDIWGKGVHHTEKVIREKVGFTNENLGSVMAIGPAGENKSKMAAIMNDRYRAAGRTGLGAVLGDKKLKAIWVYGKRNVVKEMYDPKKFVEEAKKLTDKVMAHPISQSLTQLGTLVLVNLVNSVGALPTKNWKSGVYDNAFDISGEHLAETYLKANKGCWGCTIRCSRVAEVPEGPYKTPISEGPEYETTWAHGANLLINDMSSIIKINYLENDMGFDTISFGNTVSTLMELYEKAKKGELPEKKAKELLELVDMSGIEPTWGNINAVLNLVYLTAYRNKIGDIVAEGSKRLAEYFGSPETAIHVKGLELPAYDPRALNSMALSYATSNRGGCHLRAYSVSFDLMGVPEKWDPLSKDIKKVKGVKEQQDWFSIIDSLVVCKFNAFSTGPEDYLEVLKAATGWEDLSVEELMTTGERIYNAERWFDVKEGNYVDTLPKRLLEEKLPEGPAKGHNAKEWLDFFLPEYYKLRSWENGVPTEGILKKLGLEEFINR
ncbi:MAG: aldehyde ferredoxin oxidoreductase family protein [Caldisphaeraceae archaeon]|nr:aldehyde ferredoxin oxidoreductase family protein [Caldisphaeraceae archaeon]